MRKLRQFLITLDNAQATYKTGAMIKGHVTLELLEELKVRGIRVGFHGKAHVHWQEHVNSGNGSFVNKDFRSSQVFFDYGLLLYGKDESDEHVILMPGLYTFPFQFLLPPDLSTSFEGLYGHVRYYAKGTIDIPWHVDHYCRKTFTVLRALDLNFMRNCLVPQKKHCSRSFNCLCDNGRTITTALNIDHSGYVPGQYITINGHITNLSDRDIHTYSIDLVMVTVYHSTKKSKITSHIANSIGKGPIYSGSRELLKNAQLLIPPLPPTELIGCKLIDVHYELKMDIDIAGLAHDISLSLPLAIGTQPVRNSDAVFARGPFHSHELPMTTTQPESTDLSQPGAVPEESYAQSAFGPVTIKDDDVGEAHKFAPHYIYHSWK